MSTHGRSRQANHLRTRNTSRWVSNCFHEAKLLRVFNSPSWVLCHVEQPFEISSESLSNKGRQGLHVGVHHVDRHRCRSRDFVVGRRSRSPLALYHLWFPTVNLKHGRIEHLHTIICILRGWNLLSSPSMKRYCQHTYWSLLQGHWRRYSTKSLRKWCT